MAYLSDRLFEISQMVTSGLNVADIGCDHAYLSIYLVRENIAPKVIACDINKGPVEIAVNNIEMAGLRDKIDVRLANGLSGVKPGEVKSIVIAGMGGPLIIDILSQGKLVADEAREIILEPQSEVAKVRHYLEDNGYCIISESFVCDDNKYYPIIKAVHGKMELKEEIYYRYGKILIHEANPVLHEYLIKHKKQLANIIMGLEKSGESLEAKKRLDELKEELRLCELAILNIREKDILFAKESKIN